jgi:hypothetical protein
MRQLYWHCCQNILTHLRRERGVFLGWLSYSNKATNHSKLYTVTTVTGTQVQHTHKSQFFIKIIHM